MSNGGNKRNRKINKEGKLKQKGKRVGANKGTIRWDKTKSEKKKGEKEGKKTDRERKKGEEKERGTDSG